MVVIFASARRSCGGVDVFISISEFCRCTTRRQRVMDFYFFIYFSVFFFRGSVGVYRIVPCRDQSSSRSYRSDHGIWYTSSSSFPILHHPFTSLPPPRSRTSRPSLSIGFYFDAVPSTGFRLARSAHGKNLRFSTRSSKNEHVYFCSPCLLGFVNSLFFPRPPRTHPVVLYCGLKLDCGQLLVPIRRLRIFDSVHSCLVIVFTGRGRFFRRTRVNFDENSGRKILFAY